MKISLLVPNLSGNGLHRAYQLGKVLERNHEIEVVGPKPGGEIYEPYRDEFDYKSFDANYSRFKKHKLWLDLFKQSKKIDGDIIYSFKTRPGSLGLGILHKIQTGKPLIADIDDKEDIGAFKELLSSKFYRTLGRPSSSFFNWLSSKLLFEADDITVTSSKLQEKYGGIIVPYGPNCEEFNLSKKEAKEELGIKDDYIVFAGAPREHKGVETLAKAIERSSSDIKLLLVGGSSFEKGRDIKSEHPEIVETTDLVNHSKVKKYLAISEIVVIPSLKTEYSAYQVPGKIYEAMAAGKPLIVSEVSDLPKIVEGCGFTFPPGDEKELAKLIDKIMENQELKNDLGKKAREKCKAEYGWDAMEKKIESFLPKYVRS